MKKLLVFALTALLVLSFGISTMAGTAYVDLLAGGNSEEKSDLGTVDGDLTGMVFGFNHYTEKAKFAGEYLSGTWDFEGLFDIDLTSLDLKGGFEVFENVYLTLGMSNFNYEVNDYDISNDSFFVGLDVAFNFSDNLVFEGSADFSLSSELTDLDGKGFDSTYTSYKVRLIYILEEHYAASLGYRCNFIDVDDASNLEYKYTAMTLGLSFRY